MRLESVQVGLPREVAWHGRTVITGIFKQPVAGPVLVRALNLEGDAQADLAVHGGEDKAVYAYPAEHYEPWRRELPDLDLPWGAFGENLTTSGLDEESVCLGDRFRLGGAELVVTQPRLPCYKLEVRFGRAGMVRRFLESRRTGFYLKVAQEGVVAPGDAIERIGREPEAVRVADITRVFAFERDDLETMRRALRVAALPESWKSYFAERLQRRAG
ncbi:MAG TPA: MOSC domain-containing protein [Thermoanaerobaculia bacterium]